jgi:hypothetical protein
MARYEPEPDDWFHGTANGHPNEYSNISVKVHALIPERSDWFRARKLKNQNL